LDDDVRIARDILAIMSGEKPCPKIIAAAGGRTDDQSNGLPLEIICLSGQLTRPDDEQRAKQKERNGRLHSFC
jgi:hypothetical protein